MRKRFALISTLLTIFSITPAYAGRVEPTSVSCLYFRGEKLELQQTCIYESTSWAGGGGSILRWQDGVKTTMAWGLQGRGERPCKDWSLDRVCGSYYYRHSRTLKRMSFEETKKFDKSIFCVQARLNSVCWER
jgi:hypothetical protein